MPTKDMEVKTAKNCQSISIVNTSPRKNPINDLNAIIISDVATATFISTLASITKAGMIKNPPPAPIIPVIAPTINPSIITVSYTHLTLPTNREV